MSEAVSLPEHLQRALAKRLQRLGKSLKFSASEDPVDAVHELRVASRRLRAFGIVFKDVLGAKLHSRLDQNLKRVTKAAGAVRDWDVQSGLVDARVARAASELERACLEHLLEHFDAERALAVRKAEKRLRKLDMEALSSALDAALARAIEAISPPNQQGGQARQQLERLVEQASASANAEAAPLHEEQMHQLRIRVKELRYALELFEPLLGQQYGVLHQRATELQELLGDHHDLTVLGALVRTRRAELESKNRKTLAEGMQRVEAAFSSESRALVERFQRQGFDPEWWRENLTSAFQDPG